MSAKHFAIFWLVCGLHEFGVRCDSYGGRAYTRYPACRKHLAKDDEHVKSIVKEAKPIMSVNNAKGHMGSIGILGGSFEAFGSVYFAGKTALKVCCILYVHNCRIELCILCSLILVYLRSFAYIVFSRK